MPEFLEKKLKQEYGADSKIPYKVMNARGYMRGNQETAKGRAVQRKHDRDTHKPKRATKRSTRSGAKRSRSR